MKDNTELLKSDATRRQWLVDWAADIAEHREEFALVKTDDPASLRDWFEKHPYLTTSEHAIIARVSESTIARLKLRARNASTNRSAPPTLP
jgi:hypothetical protein